MGVLTDFFIASDAELDRTFRGWAKPAPLLKEFVTRTVRNPFTGAETQIRSRIPVAQPEPAPDAKENPDLRLLPRLDQKGMSTHDLVLLASVLMAWESDLADSEINGRMLAGPPTTEVSVFDGPAQLVGRLAELTAAERDVYGVQWANRSRSESAQI